MRVSILGFGGAEIGYGGTPQPEVTTILNEALDAGMNVIDTAECYADSEEKIGAAVSHRRKDFHLFTKVGHFSGDYAHEDYSAAGIARSIDRSLQRLRTDVLDLVQLHSCSKATLQQGECIQALEDARAAGKTRFIGYSGDSFDALFAVETGRFDALQISVNIADQQSIDKVLPLAVARGMGIIAKRPLANVAWKHEQEPTGSYSHTYWKRLRELKYAFLARPLPEAVGIALRFTLAQPGVATAIVGTTKPGRWKENAAALDSGGGGQLPVAGVNLIRARWKSVAKGDWVGQV